MASEFPPHIELRLPPEVYPHDTMAGNFDHAETHNMLRDLLGESLCRVELAEGELKTMRSAFYCLVIGLIASVVLNAVLIRVMLDAG